MIKYKKFSAYGFYLSVCESPLENEKSRSMAESSALDTCMMEALFYGLKNGNGSLRMEAILDHIESISGYDKRVFLPADRLAFKDRVEFWRAIAVRLQN